MWLGAVAHAVIPATQEAEVRRMGFGASPGKKLVRPHLTKQANHGGISLSFEPHRRPSQAKTQDPF
jgi:hypothetical protein